MRRKKSKEEAKSRPIGANSVGLEFGVCQKTKPGPEAWARPTTKKDRRRKTRPSGQQEGPQGAPRPHPSAGLREGGGTANQRLGLPPRNAGPWNARPKRGPIGWSPAIRLEATASSGTERAGSTGQIGARPAASTRPKHPKAPSAPNVGPRALRSFGWKSGAPKAAPRSRQLRRVPTPPKATESRHSHAIKSRVPGWRLRQRRKAVGIWVP